MSGTSGSSAGHKDFTFTQEKQKNLPVPLLEIAASGWRAEMQNRSSQRVAGQWFVGLRWQAPSILPHWLSCAPEAKARGVTAGTAPLPRGWGCFQEGGEAPGSAGAALGQRWGSGAAAVAGPALGGAGEAKGRAGTGRRLRQTIVLVGYSRLAAGGT